MKTIRITRKKGFYGKFRALILSIDGEEVGSLKERESLDLTIGADAALLEGAMDWGRTEAFDLSALADGDTLEIKGYFSFNSARQIGAAPLPFRFTILTEKRTHE